MEKCERCNDIHAPIAEYTLQKHGYTRQIVLCKSCRDVTVQVYPLEAVEPGPAAVAEPEPESESEALEAEEEAPEVEEETASAQPTRRGRPPRRP